MLAKSLENVKEFFRGQVSYYSQYIHQAVFVVRFNKAGEANGLYLAACGRPSLLFVRWPCVKYHFLCARREETITRRARKQLASFRCCVKASCKGDDRTRTSFRVCGDDIREVIETPWHMNTELSSRDRMKRAPDCVLSRMGDDVGR